MTDDLSGINETLDERRRELAEAESTATVAKQALQSLEAEQRALYRNQVFTLEQRQQKQAALGTQGKQHQRTHQHAAWRQHQLKERINLWLVTFNQATVNLHNAEQSLTYQTSKLHDLERQLAFQRATVEREQEQFEKAQAALTAATQQPVGQVPAYPPPASSDVGVGQHRYYDVDGHEVAADGSPLVGWTAKQMVVAR